MNITAKATLAALLGYSIFGFSFLFSKIALNIASPFVLLSVRFLTAFAVLNLLVLTGRFRLSLKGKPIGSLLLLGLVQPVAYFICESHGISLTSAAFSGVMIGLIPVFGLVMGVVFLKESCSAFQVACTILSVAGVALTTTGGIGKVSLIGFFLLLGAVFFAALFANLSRGIAPPLFRFRAHLRHVRSGKCHLYTSGCIPKPEQPFLPDNTAFQPPLLGCGSLSGSGFFRVRVSAD